jgi:polyisoprenoid-binding protein YceI
MNEHMFKAIKAKEFKTITFRVDSYDVAKGGDGVRGTLNGTLTLGGAERKIAVEAAATDAGAGALRVSGAYQLRLSEYGLKAPTLMFGTMKVGDAVKVGFDLVLKGDVKVAATN